MQNICRIFVLDNISSIFVNICTIFVQYLQYLQKIQNIQNSYKVAFKYHISPFGGGGWGGWPKMLILPMQYKHFWGGVQNLGKHAYKILERSPTFAIFTQWFNQKLCKICTIFMQYLHKICTICTQYLYNICTIFD